MIYPIVAYGDPILRKKTKEIIPDQFDLKQFIEDMYETMYNASGIGLASPQVGKDYRLFITDGAKINEALEEGEEIEESVINFKKVFINPKIIKEEGEEWAFEEGCLSIPAVNADVYRKPTLTIEYYDENWEKHTETFSGMAARIIQHEYDHLEGILFTDHVSPLKRQRLKKKLTNISKGIVDAKYQMKFYKK